MHLKPITVTLLAPETELSSTLDIFKGQPTNFSKITTFTDFEFTTNTIYIFTRVDYWLNTGHL